MSPRTSLLLVASTLVGAIAVATKLIWPFQLELDRERFFAVQAAIRDAPNPVIIFGDSIVQGAALPSRVCGLPRSMPEYAARELGTSCGIQLNCWALHVPS